MATGSVLRFIVISHPPCLTLLCQDLLHAFVLPWGWVVEQKEVEDKQLLNKEKCQKQEKKGSVPVSTSQYSLRCSSKDPKLGLQPVVHLC